MQCKTCGKITLNDTMYCSNSCAQRNPEIIQKKKDKLIQTYGSLENYYALRKQKIQETLIKKYGSIEEYNKQRNKKVKQTKLEKHGSKTYNNRKKAKETSIQKYGTEIPSQSEQVKEKARQICLEKYGVENNFQIDNVKKANLKNRKEKHYQYLIENLQRLNIQLLESFEDYRNKRILKYNCLICNKEFESTLFSVMNLKCPNCHKTKKRSIEQDNLYNYIKTIDDSTIQNIYSILKNKEIDIFIPTHNLAIEFDGLYCHSEQFKNSTDHLIKTELCKEKGIQLIHIFENEWTEKPNIIKSIIKSKLGIFDKKYLQENVNFKKFQINNIKNFLKKIIYKDMQ